MSREGYRNSLFKKLFDTFIIIELLMKRLKKSSKNDQTKIIGLEYPPREK